MLSLREGVIVLFKDQDGWEFLNQFCRAQIACTERGILLDKSLLMILQSNEEYKNLPNEKNIYNSNLSDWTFALTKGSKNGKKKISGKAIELILLRK